MRHKLSRLRGSQLTPNPALDRLLAAIANVNDFTYLATLDTKNDTLVLDNFEELQPLLSEQRLAYDAYRSESNTKPFYVINRVHANLLSQELAEAKIVFTRESMPFSIFKFMVEGKGHAIAEKFAASKDAVNDHMDTFDGGEFREE